MTGSTLMTSVSGSCHSFLASCTMRMDSETGSGGSAVMDSASATFSSCRCTSSCFFRLYSTSLSSPAPCMVPAQPHSEVYMKVFVVSPTLDEAREYQAAVPVKRQQQCHAIMCHHAFKDQASAGQQQQVPRGWGLQVGGLRGAPP